MLNTKLHNKKIQNLGLTYGIGAVGWASHNARLCYDEPK